MLNLVILLITLPFGQFSYFKKLSYNLIVDWFSVQINVSLGIFLYIGKREQVGISELEEKK